MSSKGTRMNRITEHVTLLGRLGIQGQSKHSVACSQASHVNFNETSYLIAVSPCLCLTPVLVNMTIGNFTCYRTWIVARKCDDGSVDRKSVPRYKIGSCGVKCHEKFHLPILPAEEWAGVGSPIFDSRSKSQLISLLFWLTIEIIQNISLFVCLPGAAHLTIWGTHFFVLKSVQFIPIMFTMNFKWSTRSVGIINGSVILYEQRAYKGAY